MNKNLTSHILEYASHLGFDACTVCKAKPVNRLNQERFGSWLNDGHHADMGYMARNVEKRLDPTLLAEEAKSIIMLALNYYPQLFQPKEHPQFAYYAYGKDYHIVIKNKLKQLYSYCQTLDDKIEGRYFCDTAPLLERYWAAESGMGWIGKNSLLIIPQKGSYFFLAALILNIELEYAPSKLNMPSCGNCTRCVDACPTQAILTPKTIDSNRCISYQTIENRGCIDPEIEMKMNNNIYGCDICQQVCPWNRFAEGHDTPEFNPSPELLSLKLDDIIHLHELDYQRIFKKTAIKRAKVSGLIRNAEALRKNEKL